MTTTETALFTVRRTGDAPAPSLPPFGQFIGGKFVAPVSDATADVVDPATEEVLMQVPSGSVEDVDAAVAAAVAAKAEWAAKTPKDRSAVLLRIADIIEDKPRTPRNPRSCQHGQARCRGRGRHFECG
jgi:aldehyde dehydrogenase (NAD+)/aminobutyraldehyde dehydrogenase